MASPVVSHPLVQPLARPEETPECESSTCHGISVHDPVYHHDLWWNWVGLLGLAVLVLGAVGFMVGRIIAM
ncbi:hypothetical protein [Streptacidiphilus neutrinimicus]|uniref:hypothetical protein n=1 Tax=Streptacidiphilus neutrinimicus TaxID=105420 RepID=UPI000A740D53|nr:hypothetical protein [Streptacidiphilus neutrinimicus]